MLSELFLFMRPIKSNRANSNEQNAAGFLSTSVRLRVTQLTRSSRLFNLSQFVLFSFKNSSDDLIVSFVTYFLGHPSPWPAISFDLTIESIVSVSERLKDECLKDSRNGILIELK